MTIRIDRRDAFTYAEARRMVARERAAALRALWRGLRRIADGLIRPRGTDPAARADIAAAEVAPRRSPCQPGLPRDPGPRGALRSEGRVVDEFGQIGGRRAVATLGAAPCR